MSIQHTAYVKSLLLAAFALSAISQSKAAETQPDPAVRHVGPAADGIIVPTGQLIHPAGETLAFAGRPLDLALSPDGKTLFVTRTDGLMIVDTATWKQTAKLASGESGSMHGVAVRRDGAAVYMSGATKTLLEARRDAKGDWKWERKIALGSGKVIPCGIALTPDGHTACVCLGYVNKLAIVDLVAGKLAATVETDVCPYDVIVSRDGKTAYVSNFGGRKPASGEHAEPSAGTPVAVDDYSRPLSGTIVRIDLKKQKFDGRLEVGLHPAGMALRADGKAIYVANSNSDSVSVVELPALKVGQTINVRPDEKLPFGSMTNAVAVSPDDRTLYAADAGNNALAVVNLAINDAPYGSVAGFIPTGWFPGAVATDGKYVYIANVKGEGSRGGGGVKASWNSHQARGSITRVPLPDEKALAAYTRQAMADSGVPQMLASLGKGQSDVPAVPVPKRLGEPSSIEHVVYVLKENRSYDQVFGDLPRGNNDPKLCNFGRKVTPNHHALAEEFVLLDNFYCNGVLSADGHQWSTQGAVSDYQEKSFGGFPRSYDFGTDALCYAGCNFMWDGVLMAGKSFRNYGEFDFPSASPHANWYQIYEDHQKKTGKISMRQSVAMQTLRKYTCPTYPGWNLAFPDVLRVDKFIDEFREREKKGQWENLVFVYLPQDHTAGVAADHPTPQAYVADNDLALGRLVDVISHSKFWDKTVIFVNEDDPQSGYDHVDGHRSLCLVAGPQVRRRAIVSQFYNQLSVLHTMQNILGVPSTSQLVSQAPTMEACFMDKPDLTPYTVKPNEIPIDQHAGQASWSPEALREMTAETAAMDFRGPDRIDDDKMNRLLWRSTMGDRAPYPAEFAGAHGRGLRALGLKLDEAVVADKDKD